MKHNVITITTAIAATALAAGAATLEVPRLSEPATADREVSATHALSAGPDGPRVFRLELVFEATPSNHVQVCLGRDTVTADGALDAGETDLAVGWDCGGWFLSPRGLRARHAVPAASSNGTQRLTALIRVTAAGDCLPPAFTDRDGAVVFAGLPPPPLPEWLHPGTWDTLRVTARGADAPQERITITSAPDATRITIR
jgi:hypothetical protein